MKMEDGERREKSRGRELERKKARVKNKRGKEEE